MWSLIYSSAKCGLQYSSLDSGWWWASNVFKVSKKSLHIAEVHKHEQSQAVSCVSLEQSRLRWEPLQWNSMHQGAEQEFVHQEKWASSWDTEKSERCRHGVGPLSHFLLLFFEHTSFWPYHISLPIFALGIKLEISGHFMVLLLISPPNRLQVLSILSLENYFLLFNIKIYVKPVLD